ncbi:MAG: citrate/2-methylcitrate synthase, partial [Pirellulales bacterium]
TNGDLHSCVCGGIGALKGNLHGGANEAAMEMLQEIMAEVENGSPTGSKGIFGIIKKLGAGG